MTTLDTYIASALERLAERESLAARAARQRHQAGDTAAKAEAVYFQRACTAYTNALIEYRHGVRPEQLTSGAWLLPSRRPGEPPHIVRMDGDWICNCKAGSAMHWPIALIVGIEVAHDDMERLDGDDGEPLEDSPPPTPITVSTTPGGLAFSRHGLTQFITDPADVAGAIQRLLSRPADARALGARLAQARARIAA